MVYVDKFLMSIYQFLFVRKRLYWLNRIIYRLSLRGIGVWNVQNDRTSGERYFLQKLVLKYAKQIGTPLIVLDVGANVGQYSRMVRSLVPDSRVIAFEPHPVTYRTLKKTADEYGFAAINSGCGENPGKMILYDHIRSHNAEHASLFRDVIGVLHHGLPIEHEVQILELDEFLTRERIARVHLLKVDTEGYEMCVLKGLRKSIIGGRIDIIQFEFNEMNVISRTFLRDFCDYLSDYELFRMMPDGLISLRSYSTETCEIFGFQNIAALRRGVNLLN